MKKARLYQADLALIRPDQIVAWRGNSQRMFCVGLPDTSTLISALGENRRIGPGRVDVTGELCKSHALPAMPAEEASDETVERLRYTEGGLGPPTTAAMHVESSKCGRTLAMLS